MFKNKSYGSGELKLQRTKVRSGELFIPSVENRIILRFRNSVECALTWVASPEIVWLFREVSAPVLDRGASAVVSSPGNHATCNQIPDVKMRCGCGLRSSYCGRMRNGPNHDFVTVRNTMYVHIHAAFLPSAFFTSELSL